MKSFYNFFRYSKIYYGIRNFFFPHNVIKLKALPRSWSDIDFKIEAFLEQMLDDYINKEKCFEVTDWEHTPETIKLKQEILAAQDWFKKDRAALRREIDKLCDELFSDKIMDFKFNEIDCIKFAKLMEMEKILDKTNTKHYVWIVMNRGMLWA